MFNFFKKDLIKEVLKDNYESVQTLIQDKAANVHLKNKTGATPFSAAIIRAAETGDFQICDLLLKNGVNINEELNSGWTSLIVASHYGYKPEVITYLMNNGADFNHQDEENFSALMYAASQGNEDVIALLCEKGADVQLKNNDGYNALIFASSGENLNVIKTLVKHGANINEVVTLDIGETTALILATSVGQIDIVKYLLEQGADINLQIDDGSNALMAAVNTGNKELVQYFITQGADVSLKDQDGDRAIDLTDDPEMIQLLRAADRA